MALSICPIATCPRSCAPSAGVFVPRACFSRKLSMAVAASNGSSTPGDQDLQEELVDMIQVEMAKAKVKEDILADLENRKEGLRKIGDELTEQLEKKLELDKMRMELASSSSLADTMAQFKELDDEVQAIRDQLQADAADLASFEARSANARNSGLFFKQLYKADLPKEGELGSTPGSGSGSALSSIDREALKAAANTVKQPAVQEVHSPLRLYIFSYLTLVLIYVVASDVGSGAPSVALDALYTVLAIALGVTALSERSALMQNMGSSSEQQQSQSGQGPSKDSSNSGE